jgi:uncharacterized integral membrane protein (TIGR00698 family)
MFFSKENRLNTIYGSGMVAIFASLCIWLAEAKSMKDLGFSPLTIAMVLGILLGNLAYQYIPKNWGIGIKFSMQKILRLGIILYGFRVTFQQIYQVGFSAIFIDFIIVSFTFILGTYLGTKVFGLDRDTAMLTASGASICGAAAVLATEPILKSESHKTALAVATVVLFGTIAMFLYPFLYRFQLLDPQSFGIYVGATVHEVAQVVAVGTAIDPQVLSTGVIVKLTRVFLLIPFLLTLSFYLSKTSMQSDPSEIPSAIPSAIPPSSQSHIVIPWFAFMFLAVSAFNSLQIIQGQALNIMIQFDAFLLTMAMFAVGLETNLNKFKNIGMKPVYLAGTLMVWLVIGGYLLTKLFT